MSEPFLYETVDALYKGVMNNMPQALQERDVACAFVLGSAGAYGLTRGVQWVSKKIFGRWAPEFDTKWLPRIERFCIAAVVAAPVVYALVDPVNAREIMMQHPTYVSGMAGAGLGGIVAAAQDIDGSSKNTSIDNKLSE